MGAAIGFVWAWAKTAVNSRPINRHNRAIIMQIRTAAGVNEVLSGNAIDVTAGRGQQRTQKRHSSYVCPYRVSPCTVFFSPDWLGKCATQRATQPATAIGKGLA